MSCSLVTHSRTKIIVKQETQYLILFTDAALQGDVYPATWDGVMRMLRDLYPVAYEDALKWRELLESLPTAAFEEQQREELGEVCPGRFFDQMKGNRSNPHFLHYEAYAAIQEEERRPWTLRLFLYCELGLNENFHGEGRTRHPNGSLAQNEFLARNFSFPQPTPGSTTSCLRVIPVSVLLPDDVCQQFDRKNCSGLHPQNTIENLC